MTNILEKYTSVYDVFLDSWDYQSHFVSYLESLMRQETSLPTYIKEMIFAYVSGLNGCSYCKNIHAEISKIKLKDIETESYRENIDESGIEDKYKPILKFAHKVNEDNNSINDEDINEIKKYQFEDKVISEVISICAAAQFMNIVVKSHKIQPLNDTMNIASAKMMISKGYDGLADYMISKRKK